MRNAKLVYASLRSFGGVMNVFPRSENHKFKSRPNFSCSVLGEHDESRQPIVGLGLGVRALSFLLLVSSLFGFLGSFRSSLIIRNTSIE